MSSGLMNSLTEFFRPHPTIPITPWRANSRWDLAPLRVLILAASLFLFGIGESLLVQSRLGNSPWIVLSEGISRRTGINLGWSTWVISCVVLLLWIPLREKPGFGTFLNFLIIPAALQIGVDSLPKQDRFLPGLAFAVAGILAIGIASALYISTGLGPGPRDGWMMGIHSRSGIRVGRVRLAIETVVLTAGFLLGGRVGLGTALFALFIGQSIAISCGVLARLTHQ
jgi:uncharacterized membrane protein YczE